MAPLRGCHKHDPAPLQGIYRGDPGALFDTLHFLPNNRVQIALHAHTQQGIYALRGQTLELTSDRSTERLLILADGTIDGGPILGTYRLASAPTSE